MEKATEILPLRLDGHSAREALRLSAGGTVHKPEACRKLRRNKPAVIGVVVFNVAIWAVVVWALSGVIA